MYNKFMKDDEINIKVGDRVYCHGYKGTVTKVFKGTHTKWNYETRQREVIPDGEYTDVQIHFDEDSELIRSGYMQYQDGVYGEFYKINGKE